MSPTKQAQNSDRRIILQLSAPGTGCTCIKINWISFPCIYYSTIIRVFTHLNTSSSETLCCVAKLSNGFSNHCFTTRLMPFTVSGYLIPANVNGWLCLDNVSIFENKKLIHTRCCLFIRAGFICKKWQNGNITHGQRVARGFWGHTKGCGILGNGCVCVKTFWTPLETQVL